MKDLLSLLASVSSETITISLPVYPARHRAKILVSAELRKLVFLSRNSTGVNVFFIEPLTDFQLG